MNKSTQWLKQKPFAHRGLHNKSSGVIENTKSAFDLAIKAGVNIELDLQISGDGEAMVFHDPDFMRLGGHSEKLQDLTTKQIKQFSINGTSDTAQTLAEMLSQVNSKTGLLIELKSLRDGSVKLAERAVSVLKDYRGRFGLMSFDPTLVAAVKNIAPEMTFGAVVMPQTEKLWETPTVSKDPNVRLIDLLQPDFVSYDQRGFPAKFAQEFKDADKPVISWTIRDQKTADFAYKHSDQITYEGFTPK